MDKELLTSEKLDEEDEFDDGVDDLELDEI